MDYEIINDLNIIRAASIDKASVDEIAFLENGSHLTNELIETKAAAILLPNNLDLILRAKDRKISFAVFEDPRLAFAKTLNLLNPKAKPSKRIHPSAILGEGVHIGKDVSIGPHTFIGDQTIIGDNSVIHAGVVIYENVKIGIDNELHANCVIHPETVIGNKCIVHSNAVLGAEGFGFVPTKKGWTKMPQTGSVIIANDVEIGCNTTIDRPAVGETYIGEGTKIDNLVQIGHGVVIGKGCAMAAQVGIAGGAKIGNSVILAGQVGVANRVSVGDKVIASSKCGIHTDIEEGKVISGFPAMPNKLWLRCSAHFKKLPQIAKSIKQISQANSE